MPFTRRRTILFSMLAGLTFSVGAWAQSDPVFAHLDSNHDGRISLSEHEATEQATFKRMDANHDGRLTAQEVALLREARLQAASAAENSALAAQPKDGAAAPGGGRGKPSAEDAAVAQALFDRLDVNHDGTISTAEMQAAHTLPPPAQTRSATTNGLGPAAVFDTNHDGVVSAAEHAAISRARFTRMDTNGDGLVSSQEWDTAHSAPQPATTP